MKKVKKKGYKKPNKKPVKKGKVRASWGNRLSPERIRRKLLNNATGAEKLLKSYLRQLNVTFIFQKVIKHDDGFYVGDFYLPDYNLIVEVDGLYHSANKDQRDKDLIRTKKIKTLGFNLVRITNRQVYNWPPEKILEHLVKKFA
jgi:very-short-patch-repair endonuclease